MASVSYTLEDMPSDKPNCGNCDYRGLGCLRMKPAFKDGIVKNTFSGDVGGIITRCVNYKGKFSEISLF